MKIYLVTGNEGSVVTAQHELSGFDIQVEQTDVETPESGSYDIAERARHRAHYAFEAINRPLVVLDAGFYLDRWPDFPGPYTTHALHSLGTAGILKLLEGEERGCEFRHALAYIDERHIDIPVFRSVIRGSVAAQPRGSCEGGWSRYHTIFVPEGFDSPLAELCEDGAEHERYTQWRMQHSLFRPFGEWLTEQYGLEHK